MQNARQTLDFLDEVQRETRKALKLAKRRERYPSAKPYDHLERRLDKISEIQRLLRFWGVGAETFERLVPESEAMAARIAGEILAGEYQRAELLARDTPPRWIRDDAGFARVARAIRTACEEGRLGMFVSNPHAAVIANIAYHLGIDPRGGAGRVFANCLDMAMEAESWSFAPAAILFWIAHVAEKNLIGNDLPAKADENAFNGRLLTALMSAAREEGRSLAYHLGYDERYPLELGLLETDRQVIEPNVGADFCILVYFKNEDGDTVVCAALVQGKMEGEGLTDAYTTNIFRDSSFGANHQIRALTSPEKDGYYIVYPRNRATRPIVVAPAHDFLAQVLRSNPRACGDVSRLKEGDCKVRTERASVDLATFLGGVLFDPRHRCSDIGDAMAKFGKPVKSFGARARDTTFLLAERLVLVEIGGRVPEAEMTLIEAFGYQRRPAPQRGLTHYD